MGVKQQFGTKDFYKAVADKLIETLKKGTAPWQRPWDAGVRTLPYNMGSGRRYSGGNLLMLMMSPYDDPRWMTYRQAEKFGGQVRRGEKATPVAYWKFTEEKIELDDNGNPKLDKDGKAEKTTVLLERPKSFISYLFNAEQVSGLPPYIPIKEKTWDELERAENILQSSQAEIEYRRQAKAYYAPSLDKIVLPERDQFFNAEGFYATALHELSHWTGHSSRLDRPFGVRGTPDYAREELVAEISSSLLCAEIGLNGSLENHSSYINHYIKILQDDPKELFKAAAKAEKALDYILELEQRLELTQDVEQQQDIRQVAEPTPEKERTYLNVPKDEKEEAKELGAKWDRDKKAWYVPEGKDVAPFVRWEVKTPMEEKQTEQSEVQVQQEPVPAQERTYLRVSFAEKDQVKELGAKWDRGKKAWYIPEGKDVAPFARWSTPVEQSIAPEQSHNKEIVTEENSSRTYLAVPYVARKQAKAAGAQWDAVAKSWYAGDKADMSVLRKWLPDSKQEQSPALSPQEEFTDVLRSMGCIVTDEHPIMDGATHRIATEGDSRRIQSGFYVAHLDGRPAGYIKNNRTGDEIRWKSTGMLQKTKDREVFLAECAQKKQERETVLHKMQESTATRVQYQMGTMQSGVITPYLENKGISAKSGALLAEDGKTTCIPAMDVDGKVWTMQYINEDGIKRFAKDGRKEGCFHPVGGMSAMQKAPVLVVAEGYATAASLSESLGIGVVAAFDSGNLKAVATALHTKYPDKPIVIAGDDDQHLLAKIQRNPGREKAEDAAKAVQGQTVFPVFAPDEFGKYSDFNDLAQKSVLGKDAVARQVRPVLEKVAQNHKTILREREQRHEQEHKHCR